jgi:hypothetical protein
MKHIKKYEDVETEKYPSGYYWVVFDNNEIVAERVIDDDGENFWLVPGSTDTIYDNEIIVIRQIK